jgi:predicted MFS family arabinose efflux permease
MNSLSRSGTAALLAGHCAGMLDLVALPVWIGALVGWYRFDPQQAGLLASLFLGGQVVSSVLLAPRIMKVAGRSAAVGGFALAGLAFLGAGATGSYALMSLLHFAGGLGAGCALSVTHGTIGRSANPHRLFAMAGFALALFGILMLGAGSKLVQVQGGPALFILFAAVMVVALALAALAFPRLPHAAAADASAPPLSSRVWCGMIGMGLLALAQACIFSFVERLGADRGYAAAAVTTVLVSAGIVNLTPAPLAGWLQNRLSAEAVAVTGPLVHAAAVLVVTQVAAFHAYAVLVSLLIAVVVFTHTFLFGLLARLDPSGRAVAATPAMLMIGAAIGPVLGGTIVKLAGYPALGIAVAIVGVLSSLMFALMRRGESATTALRQAA